MKKVALIFGVTGQDGSYLSEFLLKKNYVVHGVKRRSSSLNTSRIDHLYEAPQIKSRSFILHYGDLTDSLSVSNIIKKVKPNEVYNLAAQSHVGVSFEVPEYTANVNAIGTLRTFTKFQNEKSQFYPRSPYGAAKVYSHWITINYREAYNIFACNGILFNHESPVRGETFVTKKIISSLYKIQNGSDEILYLGNLYAKRDWGHAKDYVFAIWKILQQKKPDDFVIATGKQYTVKDFINLTARHLKLNIQWEGKNINERAYNKDNKKIIIACDKKYFRPAEVDSLLGDAKKARKILKWRPTYDINDLIKEMISYEKKNYLNN